MKNTKKNKNILTAIVFMLIIAFLVVGSTVAWLTRTSSLTNTFTVGSFNTPTTFPDDPTDPQSETSSITISGNLYEPSWDTSEEHKLIPAATFDKDPYVGIGEGSEDAVVYVNVENNLSNKVYFTINSGWEPVAGHTTAGSSTVNSQATYTSGLFKYTAGLGGATDGDVWTTTPLFSQVLTDESANSSDFTVQSGGEPAITVSCFLHQAEDDQNNAIPASTIESAAITAFTN